MIHPPAARYRRGFTLIELLVVIAIIAILASILFPVFAKVREKARSIACESNLHQLGLAFTQYNQDFDELNPYGTQGTVGGPGGEIGVGWAASLFSYSKDPGVYHCIDDDTNSGINPSGHATFPVSYGYNVSLATRSLNALNSPTMTVELFEVTGCATDVSTLGTQGNLSMGDYSSPAADGNVAGWDGVGEYATGTMSGSQNFVGKGNGNESSPTGRHIDASNFLLADGHVKWIRPTSISTGGDDTSGGGTNCNTFGTPTINGQAAQTGCSNPVLVATFGTK
jgi:prepilin-type N-terminal cleavage/methylation domain-containing protein/prepilin-type processing-associated H-X9-DG protein